MESFENGWQTCHATHNELLFTDGDGRGDVQVHREADFAALVASRTPILAAIIFLQMDTNGCSSVRLVLLVEHA